MGLVFQYLIENAEQYRQIAVVAEIVVHLGSPPAVQLYPETMTFVSLFIARHEFVKRTEIKCVYVMHKLSLIYSSCGNQCPEPWAAFNHEIYAGDRRR